MNNKCCYGSCINSFDENGESLIDLFSDVSDFAYVKEKSLEINFNLLNEHNLKELENLLSIFKFSLKDLTDTLFEFNKVLNLTNEINNSFILYIF